MEIINGLNYATVNVGGAGFAATPRAGHCSVVTTTSPVTIVIFGGQTASGVIFIFFR